MFNEDAVIATIVKDLQREFRNVVCVDDGSGDRSSQEIRGTRAHLVGHPLNLGQGAALQTGLSYALARPGSECFVTFDGDGQHRVDDAVALTKLVRSGACDVALGSRFLGEATQVPWYKRIVLRLVAVASPSSRRLRLTDAHNGLRVMNREVAENLHITMNGMAHASEIVSFLASSSWRVDEVPVTFEYTDYSRSNGQSLVNGVNIVFDLLLCRGGRR